jgi:hypothetical protein
MEDQYFTKFNPNKVDPKHGPNPAEVGSVAFYKALAVEADLTHREAADTDIPDWREVYDEVHPPPPQAKVSKNPTNLLK